MWRASIAAVLLAALQQTPPAPAPGSQKPPGALSLYVSVLGPAGKPVPNLEQDDFEILSDGTRPIASFSNARQPITATLMFDMSNSGVDQIVQMQSAAAAFVGALEPQDRVKIGTFGNEVSVSPKFSSDPAQLLRVIREEFWPGGPTPLWPAVDTALTSLTAETGRRVAIIFTDGADLATTPTSRSRSQIEDRVLREGFTVYSVVYKGWIFDSSLESLALRSGGRAIELNVNDDLDETFAGLVDELHQSYLLTFVPEAADGEPHSIYVKVKHLLMTAHARTVYIPGAK